MTSSAYYFTDVTILSKAAGIFGKHTDYEKYTALAVKIKNAINTRYLNKESAVYGQGLQTELCVALQWGLVPEDLKSRVAENLARSVVANYNHMDVGLLGSKAILNALSENGYFDLAYTLAAQTTFPSWGWWIVNGATTLYENWPLDTNSDISMNHIMFGEIGAWMFKGLGGIFPDEENPGFRNVILKPHFVKGLDHFEAKHEGPFGTIVSSWKKDGEKVVYKVIIPANSTATLNLNATDILENDKRLSENKYIRTIKNKEGYYTLYLKSGTFLFTARN